MLPIFSKVTGCGLDETATNSGMIMFFYWPPSPHQI